MKETINEFLKFRSQFTKREWIEINQVIDSRLNEKADQLKLDDSDLEIISKRLEKSYLETIWMNIGKEKRMRPRKYPYSGKIKKPINFKIDSETFSRLSCEAIRGTSLVTQ